MNRYGSPIRDRPSAGRGYDLEVTDQPSDQRLGAPYAEYCAGTRRFLPGAPYRGEPVLVWDGALFRQNHGWQNFAGTAAFWIAAVAWLATRAGGAG